MSAAHASAPPLMLPTPGGATRSMSYLDLINDFWRLRQEVPFSSVEADMYYYLLKVSNDLNWKNPFAQPNALIGATLGVSEKTLIAARNRLKQAGLIDFQSGHKRSPTVYKLLRLTGGKLPNTLEKLQPIREVSDSVNGSVSGRNPAQTLQTSIEKEEEQTRPRPTPSAADAAPGASASSASVPLDAQPPAGPQPPVAPPPFPPVRTDWQEDADLPAGSKGMIEVWHRWYQWRHAVKGKFNDGRDGKAAKDLYDHLLRASRQHDHAGALAGLRWILDGFDLADTQGRACYDKVQVKWTSLHQLNNNINELVAARKTFTNGSRTNQPNAAAGSPGTQDRYKVTAGLEFGDDL